MLLLTLSVTGSTTTDVFYYRGLQMQTHRDKTKIAYVVIDTRNGLFDGFYFDAAAAKSALHNWEGIAERYCLEMNLMVAEVSQEQINEGIADEKFMPTALRDGITFTNVSVERTQAYTTAEVAKLLKCAPQKIRNLIHEGRIEAVNTSVGETRPRWVITAQAIDKFQQSRGANQ